MAVALEAILVFRVFRLAVHAAVIEVLYEGKVYRIADDRLEETLTRAALRCGRPISDDEQRARDLRFAHIMEQRRKDAAKSAR